MKNAVNYTPEELKLPGKKGICFTLRPPSDKKGESIIRNMPRIKKLDVYWNYSWFSFDIDKPVGTSSALFYKDGSLTACGKYYKSVTNANPQGDQSIKSDLPHYNFIPSSEVSLR